MTSTHLMSRLHGPVARGVPRWAVTAAYLIHLAVLPSCIWRIAGMTFGVDTAEPSKSPPPGHGLQLVPDDWTWLYVILLSVVSEGLAFLAFGLVCRWGEVVPRWIPRLGGSRVPINAAVVPAALGSVVLLIFPWGLFTHYVLGRSVGLVDQRGGGLVTHGWQTVAFAVSYLPLAAWGPLLGALTVHYYRRRHRAPSSPPDAARPVRRLAPLG